jgi:hypothetical protein
VKLAQVSQVSLSNEKNDEGGDGDSIIIAATSNKHRT